MVWALHAQMAVHRGFHKRGVPRHDWQRTSGVGIAQRRVQEDVRDAAAADVDGLRSDVGEDDAGGVDAPGGRLGADARLAVGREAQQPQHRRRHAVQDLAPGREGLRVVLHTRAAYVKAIQGGSSDIIPQISCTPKPKCTEMATGDTSEACIDGCSPKSCALDIGASPSAGDRAQASTGTGLSSPCSRNPHLVQLVGAGVDNLVIWQAHFRAWYLVPVIQNILQMHCADQTR